MYLLVRGPLFYLGHKLEIMLLFAPRTKEYRHYFDELPTDFPNAKENKWNEIPKYDGLDAFLEKNNLI